MILLCLNEKLNLREPFICGGQAQIRSLKDAGVDLADESIEAEETNAVWSSLSQ